MQSNASNIDGDGRVEVAGLTATNPLPLNMPLVAYPGQDCR